MHGLHKRFVIVGTFGSVIGAEFSKSEGLVDLRNRVVSRLDVCMISTVGISIQANNVDHIVARIEAALAADVIPVRVRGINPDQVIESLGMGEIVVHISPQGAIVPSARGIVGLITGIAPPEPFAVHFVQRSVDHGHAFVLQVIKAVGHSIQQEQPTVAHRVVLGEDFFVVLIADRCLQCAAIGRYRVW